MGISPAAVGETQMTTEDLIAKTIKLIESRDGYSYDPAVVRSIIEAGKLPDGTVFRGANDQNGIIAYSDRFEVRKNGELVQTIPMTEAAREESLMIHASNASRKGHAMGCPK